LPKLRRRKGQTELATAIVIIVVLAVAALVAYWYISTARSLTGRPLLRTGYSNTITADGSTAYVCVYNDGPKPVTASVTVTVVFKTSSGTSSSSTSTQSEPPSATIEPSGSACFKLSGFNPSVSIAPGIGQLDATIHVTGTTADGKPVAEELPTKLTVLGG